MSILDVNDYDVCVQPAVEAARAALKARLYVPGWSLQGYFSYIIHNPTGAGLRFRISLAYQRRNFNGLGHPDLNFDGLVYRELTPIGVGYYDARSNAVATFVKPKHRRKGVGTRLVEALEPPKQWGCKHGIYGSDQFWNQFGKNMPKKEDRQRGAYYR